MDLKELAAKSGNGWLPHSKYFSNAETVMARLWEKLVWPFIQGSDFSFTVDLAAGHGRNSVCLLPLCEKLYITDFQRPNVDICAKRFAGETRVHTFVGNGFNFEPIGDEDLTFIYCFDAMVHFDSDVVRSYLRDAFRVLKPGGKGFFHHSNYMKGSDWTKQLHGRNFMSAELFAHYAEKEGLTVETQRVINWSKVANLDCLSLVSKPTTAPA